MIHTQAIKVENGTLYLIDQTELPCKEKWIPCDTVEAMWEAIYHLKVRGAPLIGVSASLFIGLYAQKVKNLGQIHTTIDRLIAARPTAVNLRNLLEEQKKLLDSGDVSKHWLLALSHFEKDQEYCKLMGEHGRSLIPEGANILTHCNTGSLAAAGTGTALGVIKQAHLDGKNIHVYVDETRPLLQGGRLTTWELEKSGIPYTLICDNMAAHLMRDGKIDLAIVGADRIAKNGDFANKVGTYSVAVAAKYHGIPFYVAAPTTTIDPHCPSGAEIPIEDRGKEEVLGYCHPKTPVFWAPKTANVHNPSFDVTPHTLVTAFVFETGVCSADEIPPINCLL